MRGVVLALLVGAAPAWACAPSPDPSLVGAWAQVAGMPDGLRSAAYADPTDVYGHGIMGRVADARSLWATTHRAGETGCGTLLRIGAGEGHVFEDVIPRLADIDGDGAAEIVAVRSSLTEGAQLVVYTQRGNALQVLAQTPYIGRRHRWLAPAAIGDLDGDGHVEIAYVDRPHLAKVLRIWRYVDGGLRDVAAASGLTNHAIGDERIHGGLRDCGAGPEIVLSDAARLRMLKVTFDGRAVVARDIGAFSATAAVDAVACR